MSTFNPAAYARVFGRAMPNSCTSSSNGNGNGNGNGGGGCTGSYDPFRCCVPDGADKGYFELFTTIDNVEQSARQTDLKVKFLCMIAIWMLILHL